MAYSPIEIIIESQFTEKFHTADLFIYIIIYKLKKQKIKQRGFPVHVSIKTLFYNLFHIKCILKK